MDFFREIVHPRTREAQRKDHDMHTPPETQGLTILGQTVREPRRTLETFPAPAKDLEVEFSTQEFTSLCPVTGQPDYCTITINYIPEERCIESKSLKLYLWSFRNEQAFTETLAHQIARDIYEACEPEHVQVTVAQAPRGGIGLKVTARMDACTYDQEEGE